MSEHDKQKQARRKRSQHLLAGMAILWMFMALGACGKRPAMVDAPPDMAGEDKFPQIYPDVTTDPKPEKPSK